LENVVEKLPELRAELAEAYLATRKYRSALNLLNAESPTAPERARHLSMKARAHIALGDREGYEAALQELQAMDNSAVEVAFLRASYAYSQGKHQEARQILESSLAQAPEHVKTLLLLGQVSLYLNQLDKAESHLTQALTLTPAGDVMTVDRASILGYLTQTLIQQG